jgi:acyl carrier protein
LEREMAALFCEVLELEGIGARDSFLELGGKSLGAMRVLSRVRERYGVSIEMAEFFHGATPLHLAAAIELSLSENADWEQLLNQVETDCP